MARRFSLLLVVLAGSLTLVSPAMATRYWAAPGPIGVGNCTSAATACRLSDANTAANANGDEIVLTPGTYTVASQLSNSHQISIHGEDGQPRPVIQGSTSTLNVLYLTGGASLRDLEIDQAGTTPAGVLELAGTGTLDHVILKATGAHTFAALLVDPASSYTVRNSVALISSGPGVSAAAIWTDSPLNLVDVTAIGTGQFSKGLAMQNIDDTTVLTVNAKNLIVRGEQYDIFQFAGGHPAAGNTLNIDYPNYRPGALFSDNGGNVFNAGTHNQTAADPIFAADGYHEVAGSPTIGAGGADASTAPFDIDGDLRYVGATDIGADQVPLPTGGQALGQTSSFADACPGVGGGYVQTQFSVDASPSYTATSDAVITSWSTYVGAVGPGTAAELKVYDPATHTVRSQSPVETTLTPNAVNTFTASPGIVIHAGDTVAVGVPAGDTVFCQFDTPLGNDAIESRVVSGGGEPQPGDSTVTGGGGGGLRVNVQAYAEPDADHDGYGDLTQDGCPTDPSTHGACPPPGGGSGSGTGTPPSGPGQGQGAGQGVGGATVFKGALLTSRTLKVVGGFALAGQRCDRPCRGTDTLTTVIRRGRLTAAGRKRRTIVLGRASFSIGHAGKVHVKIKLSRRALAALRKRGRLAATLRAVASDSNGHSASTAARVVLKRVKKRHRH